MNKKLISRVLLFLSVLTPIHLSHSEIYKWIDEEGNVHFSDTKIEGIGQNTIEIEPVSSDWSKFEIEIQTRNVELTAQEREDIVDGVNYVYEFFDSVLYFDYHKTLPVSILILENREAYVRHLVSIGKSRVTQSYGVYFSKENQIVVYIRENREDTFKTIKHEVSHAIVHTTMPYAPAWLDEGIAEQMETINRHDRGLYIEPHIDNRRAVAWALKNDVLTDVSEFIKLPSDQWRHSLENDVRQLQSQSGQFVYFLLSTPANRNFVTSMMHKFNRGDRRLSYYIVDENYIGGVKTLEVAWSNWVRTQRSGVIDLF